MTGTAIETTNQREAAIFPGANADEILNVAADVATKFGDIVKKQRMFRRIGDSDHIQIEAWQTIGALTGVLAPDGEVEALPWPNIGPLEDEPPAPEGREPRRDSPRWREWKDADRVRAMWETHRDLLRAQARGMTYGYVSRFSATRYGAPVGWGEGSVDRNETNWTRKDDHELRSMAQTRAQSRALGAPLKFVVKLAGYESTTPAEEMDGQGGEAAWAARVADLERQLSAARNELALAEPGSKWGPVASDEQEQQAAHAIRTIAEGVEVDAERFVLAMGQHFDGVPAACVTMLRGLARYVGDARARDGAPGGEDTTGSD